LWAVPDFPPAVERLRDELFRESTSGGKQLQQFLITMLADGEQPLAIHRLLGLDAAANGQWPEAIRHFEQVDLLCPNDPFTLNNLAYALLRRRTSGESLARANELVCRALESAAGHPELLATRGEIRARMGDDVGAVADLGSALEGLPGKRPELHDTLALCYRRLGMEKIYREHLLRGTGTLAE
jgi:Flp pilus assembly protein TadD